MAHRAYPEERDLVHLAPPASLGTGRVEYSVDHLGSGGYAGAQGSVETGSRSE